MEPTARRDTLQFKSCSCESLLAAMNGESGTERNAETEKLLESRSHHTEMNQDGKPETVLSSRLKPLANHQDQV